MRSSLLVYLLLLASTTLASEEGAKDRLHEKRYPSGAIEYKANVSPEGVHKNPRWFDEDGQPRSGVRLEGLSERTYDDGTLKRLRKFRENGCLEFDSLVDEHGLLHKTCEYDEKGNPKTGFHTERFDNGNYWVRQYHEGKKHGVQRFFEDSRQTVEETWLNGGFTSSRGFFKSGATRFVTDYKNGKQIIRRDYFETGSLDCERFFRDGVEVFRRYRKEGGFGEHYGHSYTSHYKSGSVETVGQFDPDGGRVGAWTSFREDGSLAERVTYVDDTPKHVKRYDQEGDVVYDGEPDQALLDNEN